MLLLSLLLGFLHRADIGVGARLGIGDADAGFLGGLLRVRVFCVA